MRIWEKRSQITVFFLPKILENCPEKHQETPYENPLGANFRVFLHFLWGVNLCAEFGCFFEKPEKNRKKPKKPQCRGCPCTFDTNYPVNFRFRCLFQRFSLFFR